MSGPIFVMIGEDCLIHGSAVAGFGNDGVTV